MPEDKILYDSPQALRVAPDNKPPSYANHEALTGAAIGMLVPLPFATLIGAAIGGYLGRTRMQREQTEGKVVEAPKPWNRTLLYGAVVGLIIGGIAAFALTGGGLLGLGALVVKGVIAEQTVMAAAPALTVAANVLAWGVQGAGILIGAKIGSKKGEERMQKDWQQAQAYVQQRGEFVPRRSPSAEQQVNVPGVMVTPEGPSYKNSVSAEETALLNTRLAERSTVSATEKLTAQPALATGAAR